MDRKFVCTIARFHKKEPCTFVVQGYFAGGSIAGSHLAAFLDGEELKTRIEVREGLSVRQKYFANGYGKEEVDREYSLIISLPENWSSGRLLKVVQTYEDKKYLSYRCPVRRLKKEQTIPDGYLENLRIEKGRVYIGGWAVGSGSCRLTVTDASGRVLESETDWLYRRDIAENYPELINEDIPEENSYGYEVSFRKPAGNRIRLLISASGQEQIIRINLKKGLTANSRWHKALSYYRRNGLLRTVVKIREKITEKLSQKNRNYMRWRRTRMPSREQLQIQRRSEFANSPLISVVVPLYRTKETYLRALVASVKAQTWAGWELCLSDGSGKPSPLTGLLKELSASDSRIRFCTSDQPLGISENTNAALAMSRGDYIAFSDHDDLLPPFALYELVKRINEEEDAELIYSDEDKVSMDGKTYFQPHFKTDFNIDLLTSMNYICHLTAVKRSLLERVGLFRAEYNGAQDYDFILRCAEQAKQVSHIPMVLYHWRAHPDSTSENPSSKRYAFEAGMRAVQAHYDRIGVKAVVSMGQYPGLYVTSYQMPEDLPLISVIIPNKDHAADLDQCLESIFQKIRYPRYEILIIENNSSERETFAYYERLENRRLPVRILTWEEEFNFSRINNFGAEEARGDYLLFLNNDTEIISQDCFEQLLGPALRREVGAVGARLFYGDNTIQHAGVVIGYGGIAGHAFQGKRAEENGYFSRIICQSDVSAVTAACMLVRREVFEEVGGFEESLKVAFNDIDFCLKVREAGYLVVYNPQAMLYHYESKSRGMEDTAGKIARFNQEADLFLKRWPQILRDGDPYYNPNLSLDSNDFALR